MIDEQRHMFDNPVVKARQLKAEQRYDEALKLLTEALTASPDNLKLMASLADLYYRTAKYKEALTLAGSILRKDPDDPRALVVMGNTLLTRKQPQQALEYFRLASQVAATDYIWSRIAKSLLAIKKPEEALEAIRSGQVLSPNSRALLRLQLQCLRMQKDASGERELLQRAAKAAPGDQEDFFSYFWPILNDLQPKRAALVSARLRETPNQEMNPHLLLFEAESLFRFGDRESAEKKIAQITSADPPEAVARAAESLLEKFAQEKK